MPQKILIVEDETPILQMYKYKLSQKGFDVQTADNGEDGLAKCEEFEPNLMLLDLRMPKMSGSEMLEKVRAADWGSNIRVIVLTNISKDEAPSVLRFLRVDRYIVKAHHTPEQVAAIVAEVLTKT